jgi:methionyl-tRNA formyltransferase
MAEPHQGQTEPVRIYVAGAWGALITEAVQLMFVRDSRTVQVGLDLDRLDPASLREARPDLLISAAHSHLIRPAELAVPRIGSIGIHPSLLPRYRGSHPLWWAIKNRERQAGVSIYVLEAGIDTGAILAQRSVPIAPDDTFLSLYLKVVPLIPGMLSGLIGDILTTGGLPAGTQQDERIATFYRAPTPKDMTPPLRERFVRRLRRVVGFGQHKARG